MKLLKIWMIPFQPQNMKVLCFQRNNVLHAHLYISCRKLQEILRKSVNSEKKIIIKYIR